MSELAEWLEETFRECPRPENMEPYWQGWEDNYWEGLADKARELIRKENQ